MITCKLHVVPIYVKEKLTPSPGHICANYFQMGQFKGVNLVALASRILHVTLKYLNNLKFERGPPKDYSC